MSHPDASNVAVDVIGHQLVEVLADYYYCLHKLVAGYYYWTTTVFDDAYCGLTWKRL